MYLKSLHTYFTIALSLVILFCISCNKSSDSTVPTVVTYGALTNLTQTYVRVYGAVTDYGSSTLTADGFCYSATNSSPGLNNSVTSNTIDTLQFSAVITSLIPNTTYYIRAYATTSAGTAYGNVLTFKTPTATFTQTATVSTFAGSGTAGLLNGTGIASQFHNPAGMCIDAAGNIYVSDAYNNVIRKITPAGVASIYAGNGTLGFVNGTASSAEFYAPQGLCIDPAGNLYVADMGNNMIRKITPGGGVSTLAGQGYAGFADGTGNTVVFRGPTGVCIDASGTIYVADKGNNVIREVSQAGVSGTLAGNLAVGQVDGTAGNLSTFDGPTNICVDKNNNVYVTDNYNHAIRVVSNTGAVTTLVGNYLQNTILNTPAGICIDPAGDLFITDATGRVLEITANGVFYSLAGIAGTSGFVNGTNTNALFNNPQAITIDAAGNLYVADYYNNVIRKVVVTTTP